VGAVVTYVVIVLLLTGVGSRLLGMRLPLLRALALGFPGLGLGILFAYFAYRRHPGHITAQVWGVGLVSGFIATMVVLVLSELISRQKLGGSPGGVPRPWRALRRKVRNARRYVQLSRIAASYGLRAARRGGTDPAQLGRRLRAALEEAGPIFVKLGQVLSTRSELLPVAVTTELAKLQDDVPPTPWRQIETVLEEELGAEVGKAFPAIDPEPLASASLAQAYGARLPDGSSVVLKVQRPGVDELVARDLDMIRRVARRLEVETDWAARYHVEDVARSFADALAEELDFRVEARNISAVAAAAPPHPSVLVPTVHNNMSSRRLLVLERFEGISVRDAGPQLVDDGADRDALARELLGFLLRQILLQGTFHADPHPGNVLYLRSGQLALIDFGSVGRLDVRQQGALRRLFVAVAQRDPTELYDAVTELAVGRAQDEESLEQTLATFMTRHLGAGASPDVAFLRDLMNVLAGAGVTFPSAVGSVFHALVVLDGTLRAIAPGFDLASESHVVARQLASEELSPGSLRESATAELLTLLPLLRKLPRRVDRISAALAGGRFTINHRLLNDPNDVAVLTSFVNRAVLGLLGAGLGLMSVILLLAHGSPVIAAGLTVLDLLGYVGLFLSVSLIFRVAVDILSPPRHR
jgi:ubiquinone biosynthesis protein